MHTRIAWREEKREKPSACPACVNAASARSRLSLSRTPIRDHQRNTIEHTQDGYDIDELHWQKAQHNRRARKEEGHACSRGEAARGQAEAGGGGEARP